MRILSTGKQIGQAVKNVQRLRQILGVFAAHGFSDFVNRMNLGRYLPASVRARTDATSSRTVAQSLRESFDQLGPTFVKLGQVLSTRPDLLPEDFIEELKKLQDDVAPLPFEQMKAVVEAELGKPLSELFDWVSEQPLAAASISQVHEARLKTGEKVVLKIQRPEIKRIIETDISLLQFLAKLLEKYIPEARIFNPETIVAEFFMTLSFELDFIVEANNMEKIRKNTESIPDIVIPKIHRELCSKRVLTLEKLEGIRMNDLAALNAAGVDRTKLVRAGARAFFKSIVIDGLFHGDLHGGNLFVLPGDQLGIIDFGIVGRLSPRARDQLVSMVVALMSEDYETLCYQYAELGAVSSGIDFDAFVREVRNTIAPYMGLALGEVNAGKVLIEATRIAARYKIRIPGDWMIVFKGILTVEGMGRQLDPGFDLLSAGNEFVKEMVKNRLSVDRLKKELFLTSRELVDLIQILPRQLRFWMRKWNANDFAFELKIPELRELRRQQERSGRRSAEALVAAGALIASAISYGSPHVTRYIAGVPAFSFVFLVIAGLFGFRSLWK